MTPFQKSTFAAAISLSLFAAPAIGQTLDDLEIQLREHPSLVAMRSSTSAERDRAIAAKALPDPVVSFGINNFPIFDPSFNAFVPTNTSLGVRQQFPNMAGRRARAAEANGRANVSDAAMEMQFDALRAELLIALIERRKIALQREILQQQNSKYDELSDVVAAEIDAGRPAVFRLAEIDVERARVARRIADLKGEEARINAQLINLVGAPVGVAPPPMTIPDWQGSPQSFHAVRVADSNLSVSEARVDQAKAAFRPEFGVQFSYQLRQEGSGAPTEMFAGDDFVSGMVTFTVPLWAKQSQEPTLRAAQSDRASARSLSANAARQAAAQYASYEAIRFAAEDSLIILKEQIAAIEDQMASQLTTYESGIGDYSPIIDGEIAILALKWEIENEITRRDTAIALTNALLVTS